MSQIVNATFEEGVFRPDVALPFPPMTRVRLIVELLPDRKSPSDTAEDAAETELNRLWDEIEVDSGGPPPHRDELYDRH
jgi:hypothetical protein